MRDLILGSLAAAFAMFLWGFLFWGVGLIDPFAHTTADAEAKLAKSLNDNLPATGVYFVPDPSISTPDKWSKDHIDGPIVMVVIKKVGADPMAASKLVMGYMHMVFAALLLGIIMIISNRPSYTERLQLGILVGLAGTLFANLTSPIWFDAPWGYHITNGVYQLIAWALAAAILAYFIRRKTTFI